MYRIYPLNEAALDLEERYRDYLDQGGQYLHMLSIRLPDNSVVFVEQLPKPAEYHSLLMALMDDRLNELLEWASPTKGFLQQMDKSFPLYLGGDADRGDPVFVKASEEFYSSVIAHFEERINDWLDEALGEEPDCLWRIWHVRLIGDDILLEQGIDYRIYDWEQRTKSGEWKREETSHILDG